MWKTFQACAHFIHLALHSVTNRSRKRIKCFRKCRRPNLQRGGRVLFWLARGVLSRRNFGAGLVKFGFYVVSQCELVFKIIVDPFPDFFDFRPRQLWNRRFDFLNRTHAGNVADMALVEKAAKIGWLASGLSALAAATFSHHSHHGQPGSDDRGIYSEIHRFNGNS